MIKRREKTETTYEIKCPPYERINNTKERNNFINKEKRIFLAILCYLILLLSLTNSSLAQSEDSLFQQAVTNYQESPTTDNAEKVIELATEMDKLPPIPEEARRHYVKGCTLFDDAKQPSESADAAEEFRQALLIAPWWGEAYMKMGLALETAQRYDDAITSLKLFMITNPQDSIKTQEEIWKIEARQEKAAKDKELAAKKTVEEERARQEAAQADKAREQEEFLRKIDGVRYITVYHGHSDGKPFDYTYAIDIRGDRIMWTEICYTDVQTGQSHACYVDLLNDRTMKIVGREIRLFFSDGRIQATGIITEDGSTIQFDGQVYERQR